MSRLTAARLRSDYAQFLKDTKAGVLPGLDGERLSAYMRSKWPSLFDTPSGRPEYLGPGCAGLVAKFLRLYGQIRCSEIQLEMDAIAYRANPIHDLPPLGLH